ncbi:hypothetical protein NLG97_g4564 [Lecanicillium saksenae]|uniref:Uncharacterized protein n=1 Tax=Lecanicillium saksenae TaxID=468837 RepID=A0ACC1QV41_9HYPO|nr:hypothetical protein NLG97_g4564 [Lecanicillium saksenae]
MYSRKSQVEIVSEAEPPSWDYLQCIRYYFTIARPSRALEHGKVVEPYFHPKHATYYICVTIADQLRNLARSRGRLLTPGEEPSFLGRLWEKYNQYLLQIVMTVNEHLHGNKHGEHDAQKRLIIPGVISYIYVLVGFDLGLASGLWLSHVKGFLAYTQHCGGPKAVIQTPGAHFPFARFFSKVVTFNTITPAKQQLLGYSDYTERQIETLLGYEFDMDNPFPMDARIAVVRITRLRHQVATGTISTLAVPHAIKKVFKKLSGVDIDSWVRKDNPLESDIAYEMGRIFCSAVWVYGLLTLPRSALSAWATTQPGIGSNASFESLLSFYTSQLLEQLRELFPLVAYKPSFKWALAVAGVATATRAPADRSFVDDCLLSIWLHPQSSGAVLICLEKLRAFWSSGKTGWEDCFDEPCAL